jgi:hypothetical protein
VRIAMGIASLHPSYGDDSITFGHDVANFLR